ncbi:alpha/beta hydrolase [Psychroflexus aestuariivivens]|uniref:alpha/beta hydrolase n=1 Tax=Psychroflexus aestuariivivens TaxID=1795040 RepID=UPI000FDB1280|nr:alpha/beta hydrolase-fold protein [Psychroflexus aestuariivivens]
MKIRLLIIVIIGLTIVSCQSNESGSNLESKMFTDSIYSKHLDEYRKHNVYLPKDFDKTVKYPILYRTDGSTKIENSFYKRTLDSLIENKIIKPLILISSHSNSKIADSTSVKRGNEDKVYLQYRNFEYINDHASTSEDSLLRDRFKNHMLYFKNELIPKAENEFNQKLNKEDRYFYGFSNGAGFGMSLLNAHPNTIGTYLCFSTFGGDIKTNAWKEGVEYPKVYLEYGSKEPSFLKKDAAFLRSKFEELDLELKINEFEGGHDYKMWQKKFTEIISEILAT